MAENLMTTNRYFDNKHYPCGFSRRNDFTIKEAQLLGRHGYALNELDLGECEPVTGEEELFVAVCRGEYKSVTEAECVQSKYMMHVRRPERFHMLFGRKPQVEDAEGCTESGD